MVSTIGGSDIALGLDRVPVLVLGSVGWLRLGGTEVAHFLLPVLQVHVFQKPMQCYYNSKNKTHLVLHKPNLFCRKFLHHYVLQVHFRSKIKSMELKKQIITFINNTLC